MEEEIPLIILHIYIHTDATIEQRSRYWNGLKEFILLHRDTPLMICGDLNTKSPLLCETHREPHEYFEDFINELELEVLNTGAPTGSKAWSICKTLEPDMRTRRKPICTRKQSHLRNTSK
jgi:hypothetical protein